jgi:hypothetical protein
MRSSTCVLCCALSILILLLGAPNESAAQDTIVPAASEVSLSEPANPDVGPYFYRGLPYGSEAYYGPLAVILNKGFALSLMEGGTRRLADFPYGIRSVADALAHPTAAIERQGGLWRFVREEMLPLSWSPDGIKWWTNYTGHLIEGGIHWRQLKEWYEAHGVPLAGLMSGITTMSAALLNEAYESNGATAGSAATVADLYFFDLAGIVLFSFDGVSRFFSRTLNANLWTGQASLVFPAGETDNNASHVYFKIPWSPIPNSSLFLWNGIGFLVGLSLHRGDGLDISFGAGTDAAGRTLDPVTGREMATLTFGAGLFVDRNGSLLASAHVSQVHHRLLRLNVYPGVLGGPGENLGAWMILSHDFEVRFGISNRFWLGAGLGLGK